MTALNTCFVQPVTYPPHGNEPQQTNDQRLRTTSGSFACEYR